LVVWTRIIAFTASSKCQWTWQK